MDHALTATRLQDAIVIVTAGGALRPVEDGWIPV